MIPVETIPPDDRGFTLGDGLFETLLWRDGGFEDWDAHMARLERGCLVLGLPQPVRAELLAAGQAGAAGLERGVVRLTWTAGSGGRGLERPQSLTPRLTVSAVAASASNEPLHAAIVSIRRNEGSPASRLKTTSYLDSVLARREALASGAAEAIMLNNRGELACGAAANLFWVKDGLLHTPALDCGVLDGIIRGRIIAALPVREVRMGQEALEGAEAIYLTNSLIGVRAVTRMDGREIRLKPDFQVQVVQAIAEERRGRR